MIFLQTMNLSIFSHMKTVQYISGYTGFIATREIYSNEMISILVMLKGAKFQEEIFYRNKQFS